MSSEPVPGISGVGQGTVHHTVGITVIYKLQSKVLKTGLYRGIYRRLTIGLIKWDIRRSYEGPKILCI